MCFVLVKQVATVPIPSTDKTGASAVRERYESGVHTINNANPYQGVTITEGHGNTLSSLSHYKMFRLATQLTRLLPSLILPCT